MKYLLLYTAILLTFTAKAQYTERGKIEYERKMNVYRTIEDMDEDDKRWIEKFKSQLPKFTSNFYELYFDTERSLYKPGSREPENVVKMWFANTPGSENIIYTDLKNKHVKGSKQVFEEKFLVQDSMRHIQWKIMDEIRTIADYKCRKAVGKICDSVYVVAFYTDDIIANSGPEMFGNLPGMILELAIPRLHTTWVATKVDITPPKEADFAISDKGKKVNEQELYEAIKPGFKRWGKRAERYIWWSLL